jgi:DNA-binding transcriptional LysR family regulator
MTKLPMSGLEVFLAVAEHRSLRGAAAALEVQPPAISYGLKRLEEQIGVTLFMRTTRSVQLTDAGRALLQRVRPALSEVGDALEQARGMGRIRKGTIRITLPYFAYELAVAPRLVAFGKTYPDVELELSFSEAFVDLVADGFHAGIRMGDHIQEDMIAVRLTPPLKVAYFASPDYLKRHGRPRQPQDLLRHNCIRYRYIATRRIAEWQFVGDGGIVAVDVKGSLTVNSTNALIHAAREGLGIGWLFRPSVAGDLRSGRLVSLLDDFAVERPGLFLYYPRAYASLEILRVFIDFLKLRRAESGRRRPADRRRLPRRSSRAD